MGNKSNSKMSPPTGGGTPYPDPSTFSQSAPSMQTPTTGNSGVIIATRKSSKNLMENFQGNPPSAGQHVLAAKRSSRSLHSPPSDNQLEIQTPHSPKPNEHSGISPGRLPGRGEGFHVTPTTPTARPSITYSNPAAASLSPLALPQPPPLPSAMRVSSSPSNAMVNSPTATAGMKSPPTSEKKGLFGRKSAPNSPTQVQMTPAQVAQLRFTVEITRLCVKGDLMNLHNIMSDPKNTQFMQNLNINHVDKNGGSFLMYASMSNHHTVVKYLLDLGANPDQQNETGWTALLGAADKGHIETVQCLLQHKATPDLSDFKNGATPLIVASIKGHLPVVQLLVEHGANVNLKDIKNEDSPLMKAAEANQLSIIKYLIDKGAQLDAKNKEEKTVFDYPVTKELLMSILSDHIVEACRTGNMEMFKRFFLPSYMDINKRDAQGATFLMYAAQFGILALVEFLVDHGGDIHACSKDGSTALLYSCEAGHLPIVEYLINRGSVVNAQDKLGHTALMCACYGGYLEIVKYLVDKGADLNLQDTKGSTAIMYAAVGTSANVFYSEANKDNVGHRDVVEYLISKGALLNIYDVDGKSIVEVTVNPKLREIVRVAQIRGNKLSIQYAYRQYELNKFEKELYYIKKTRELKPLEEGVKRKRAFLTKYADSFDPKLTEKYSPDFYAINKRDLVTQRNWLLDEIVHYADQMWEMEETDEDVVRDIKWTEDTFQLLLEEAEQPPLSARGASTSSSAPARKNTEGEKVAAAKTTFERNNSNTSNNNANNANNANSEVIHELSQRLGRKQDE